MFISTCHRIKYLIVSFYDISFFLTLESGISSLHECRSSYSRLQLLLQLPHYLVGEALFAIDSLEHSAHTYKEAKERLEMKLGVKRLQVLVHFEDFGNFPQIRFENANDLEQFSDILDIAETYLHEAGKYNELGNGFLYITLQRK